MPITILEVPKSTWDDLVAEEGEDGQVKIREEARALCEAISDEVHTMLRVPDPEDKAIRVITTDRPEVDSASVTIAYSTGDNEYPDCKRRAFKPGGGLQSQLLGALFWKVRRTSFGISQTRIEAWGNTTYIVRSLERDSSDLAVSEEELEYARELIDSVRLRVFISPSRLEWAGGQSLPEGVSSPENAYGGAAGEIAGSIRETLGLPEDADVTSEVYVAMEADGDISVELDFLLQDENHVMSENVRRLLAYVIEQSLNDHELTQEREESYAEIWVRQGFPCIRENLTNGSRLHQ